MRIPLPVSTVSSTDIGNSTYIPRSGLDFLERIPSIHIEQTFELYDMSTAVSENRYTIRAPSGDAIYAASESSRPKHRLFLGAGRPFGMHLLDKTHQEALTLIRKMPCGLFCLPFVGERLEIWAPPGDFLGCIKEIFSVLSTEFVVENGNQDKLFRISGPALNFCTPKELHFKVLSYDSLTQKGSITRKWNTDISTYTMNIYYSDPNMDPKVKALFIGSAFLLVYLYYIYYI